MGGESVTTLPPWPISSLVDAGIVLILGHLDSKVSEAVSDKVVPPTKDSKPTPMKDKKPNASFK